MKSIISLLLVLAVIVQTACGKRCDPAKSKAECLSAIIEDEQYSNVKESYGEWANQCFTWDDLDRFKDDEVPNQIAQDLKSDEEFIEVILALKNMPKEDQRRLLKSCRKPLRPTWRQLGEISSKGQTDAGQRAELLIANAIVDLAEELLKLTEEEIEKLK